MREIPCPASLSGCLLVSNPASVVGQGGHPIEKTRWLAGGKVDFEHASGRRASANLLRPVTDTSTGLMTASKGKSEVGQIAVVGQLAVDVCK